MNDFYYCFNGLQSKTVFELDTKYFIWSRIVVEILNY